MRKNREPEPDQAAEDYLNAESADGTRHLGCGQPWIYRFPANPGRTRPGEYRTPDMTKGPGVFSTRASPRHPQPTKTGDDLMPNLALVPSLPVEAVRVRKPCRRPGSFPVPSKVTELHPPTIPDPDPDAAATARYLARHGWTSPDVHNSAYWGLDVWAALLAREIAEEAGPSCPA